MCRMSKWICILVVAAGIAGCQSNLRPILPLQQVEEFVPDATTQPAASGPATEAATQPGHTVMRTVDPNQSARFIYNASYDNVWAQATALLNKTGFSLDRKDYRLGVLTTLPLQSSQIIEFWKPQFVNGNDALENTINSQRRSVRLTISKVPEKPDFYEIGIQVLVERETNPTEGIGGPLFVEGSAFGRNAVTLRSDYATPKVEAGRWITVGHDPDLEGKLLDALFQRI